MGVEVWQKRVGEGLGVKVVMLDHCHDRTFSAGYRQLNFGGTLSQRMGAGGYSISDSRFKRYNYRYHAPKKPQIEVLLISKSFYHLFRCLTLYENLVKCTAEAK